jgi:tetratricopeptide (TPR) repeat protein/phage tail protein X
MTGTSDRLLSLLPDLLYQSALDSALTGSYDRAERLLSSISPEHQTASHHVLWGRVCAQRGDYGGAISHWEKALDLDPDAQDAARAIYRAQHLTTHGLVLRGQGLRYVMTLVAVILFLGSLLTSYDLRRENLNLKESLVHASTEAEEASSVLVQRQGALVEDLASLMQERLSADAGYWEEMRVQWDGISLRLSGKVPTDFCRHEAQATAERLARNLSVDVSGLEVTHRYRVKPGDTLYGISQSLYGTPSGIDTIFSANPGSVSNPDAIYDGVWLTIP